MKKIVLLALLPLLMAACNRPHGTQTSSTNGVAQSVGDVEAGRQVFTLNCATCHGATGVEGGVGPSLRGERTRKDLDATIAWIKNPSPPMPALFPQTITDQQVTDVATYVQKL